MSRIFIKNIPTNFTEKELVASFNDQEITDCKVMRDDKGKTRKFGFIGFKDKLSAEKIKAKYHQTFLGGCKIAIEIAKNKQQIIDERSRSRDQHKDYVKNQKGGQANSTNQTQKRLENKKIQQKSKVFEEYKKIIEEGGKKSWDDMIIPASSLKNFQEEFKKTKSQNKDNKAKQINQRTKTVEKQKNQKIKKQSIQQTPKENELIQPKAPRLSEKNKKYVNKPLQINTSRLYITNIPFNLPEQELSKTFQKYGSISKIKLPKETNSQINKGYAFITYEKAEEALRVFQEVDNTVVFGRIIHIKPSLEDIGEIIKQGKQHDYQERIKEKFGDNDPEVQKTSFKKQKKKIMREKLNDATSWNTLFLNPNTILQRISKKLKMTKAQILQKSQNLAAKISLAQAEIINQTKQWMISCGLNLQFLLTDRSTCIRSQNILLIKNLNYNTSESDLKELLEFYGQLQSIHLAPNKAICIAQFKSNQFATNVLANLQNHKFKNNFLMIQKAPVGILRSSDIQSRIQTLEQQKVEEEENKTKVLYIKNLNFDTQDHRLEEVFSKIGAIKYVKIIKSKEKRSMGYGFVEFQKAESAIEAIKKLQNYLLDGHKLVLSISKKKQEKFEEIKNLKEKIQQKSQGEKSSKLLVKNIPFQSTKNELKQIFEAYGSVKKIRIPKKMDGNHRGFAFVEYDNAEDSAIAKQMLGSVHLYGRKLVIEYEKGSSE